MKNEAEHLKSNQLKWDKWADSRDGQGWRDDYLRDAQRKLISLLDIRENVRFLDVGCGAGSAVGEVARLAANKGLFYGVDLSPKMIEKAKGKFSGKDNYHFIQANAESIPLDDESFDIIICTNSFHHYLHPDKALKEMYRLLRTGGKIYILDPTADNWMAKAVDKIIKRVEPEHVKLYSTKEFQQLFGNARIRYATSETVRAYSKVHIGEK
jgi:ubiquinone/menaquinone biosynthesis C-methylase UbiE